MYIKNKQNYKIPEFTVFFLDKWIEPNADKAFKYWLATSKNLRL